MLLSLLSSALNVITKITVMIPITASEDQSSFVFAIFWGREKLQGLHKMSETQEKFFLCDS